MIHRLAAAAFLFLFASSVLSAQVDTKSTREERQGWAATLHKLEANPLDPQTQNEASHAANRLKDVDDVTINPCGFVEVPNKWNKSWGVVIYLLGLSAYQIETGKTDAAGENLYALRSVLKAYASAIASDPKLHDKKLDALSKTDAEGKLPDLLAKDCR